MFSITGIVCGCEETLTYELKDGHGVVIGGPHAMAMLEMGKRLSSAVGPVGQDFDRDLNIPLAALFMMKECFSEVTSYEGDLPVAASIPDDAIG